MPETMIDQTISYLLAQICKAHRGAASDILAEVGLHAGQEIFLLQLWQQDGLTQTQLAGSMCVQPPTVNKMLSRMESAGLVTRRQDAEDSRVSRVYLTEKSRDLQGVVEETWAKLDALTLANFTLEERVLLRRLLLQLHENLTRGE